jgi:hypothetical protein
MTINELRDYLSKYTGEGKGDATVLICGMRDNPLEASKEIKDSVFLEWIDGEYTLVIQIGENNDGK